MRTSIVQSVLKHVLTEAMIAPGDRVGVAVSGGADSVALFRILEEIRKQLGVSLSVVHFDHQLRGEESERDAQFVCDLARGREIDFIAGRQDVAAEAKRNGWNLEDAARRLRYAFFQRVFDEGRATRIAVAHTADDQSETVLSHLIRGTGPAGLGGIHPVLKMSAGQIIRPLLPFRREDLRAYLRALGQTWQEDSTNNDLKRIRARIRTQLLPVLQRDFSPSVVDRLCELARLSREDEVFWSALVEERYSVLAQSSAQGFAIRVADLLEPLPILKGGRSVQRPDQKASLTIASRPLTERLIRRLYQEAHGNRQGLGAEHVEQVIRLATRSTSGRRVELPGGIIVERTFDQLFISRTKADGTTDAVPRHETVSAPIAYQYIVALPSTSSGSATISVPEVGSRFCLKLIDWADSQRETTKDSQTFDADSLRAPLILRNWRPGDAYTPSGRRQPRKLKQMFLAAHIPVRQRRDWPVLESGGAVIWARGMPVAEAVRPCETTRVGVEIAEEKL
jgi:tRNA(Ile)-lysidine synthase